MSFHPILFALFLASPLFGCDWFPDQIEAPTYPVLANQAAIQGLVSVKLTLSQAGDVIAADVISGNLVLAKAAKANLLLWKFAGICSTNESLPTTIEFKYRFRLTGVVMEKHTTQFRYQHPYRVTVLSQALHFMPEKTE